MSHLEVQRIMSELNELDGLEGDRVDVDILRSLDKDRAEGLPGE